VLLVTRYLRVEHLGHSGAITFPPVAPDLLFGRKIFLEDKMSTAVPAQPKFRLVDKTILEAIKKTTSRCSLKKPSNTTIAVVKQGNFTIVLLKDTGSPGMGVGVAKRSTRDPYNAEAGFYLALHRATLMLYPKMQIADLMQELYEIQNESRDRNAIRDESRKLHENQHGIQGVFYSRKRGEETELEFL
jgi:hypothetical protein